MSRSIEGITRTLRAAGCVFAEDEAILILADVPTDLLDQVIAQRVAGQPLEYLLGWGEFYGLRIAVQPGVFVPRRRSEVLVRAALPLCQPGMIVIDMCCGAGPVAAALQQANPTLRLYGVDVSRDALDCATANVPGMEVFEGDLYDALPTQLRGTIELIVANAPYVPTDSISYMPTEARDHENRSALDGGPDGTQIQKRVAEGATRWLAPGGTLMIETSVRQAPLTEDLMNSVGFRTSVVREADVDGTAVVGVLPDP
ncbi:MAG: putative protein N(5)-glutamine methyltransferase [Antricoccus sp.]